MLDEYDILIKNASIVDGTGSPAFKGEIAVVDDRIEAIGKGEGELEEEAQKVIDAKGHVVTPGFIDVHNHGDITILYYPKADGFLRQGITTFIGGNCGSSPGPYGDYVVSMFASDIAQEINPDMYYPDRLIPQDC